MARFRTELAVPAQGCASALSSEVGVEQATVHAYAYAPDGLETTAATTAMQPSWQLERTSTGRSVWIHLPEPY